MRVTTDPAVQLPAAEPPPAGEGQPGLPGVPDFGALVAALLGRAAAPADPAPMSTPPQDQPEDQPEDPPEQTAPDAPAVTSDLTSPLPYAVPVVALPVAPVPVAAPRAAPATDGTLAVERPAVAPAPPQWAPPQWATPHPLSPAAGAVGTDLAPAPADPVAPARTQEAPMTEPLAPTPAPTPDRAPESAPESGPESAWESAPDGAPPAFAVDRATAVPWTASDARAGRPTEGPRTEAGHQLAPVLARILTTAATGAPTTHRVTLRLHPEELGEVRVALTVRDGEVQVTLSAGETARDLLRRDSGLLHHLLGQGGAERVEVAFRALPGSERREPSPGVSDQGGPAGDPTGDRGDPGSGGSTGRDPRDARPAFTGEGRHPWHGRGAATVPRGGTATHSAPPLGSVRPHAALDITV
jgi:hypothetical protein